ncbi:glycine betaine ABC transporter substrate-binding protein [Gracilibacillus salinarum]|uniref:Glycine/betaine ABC transporter n=1 Tax=Gracilibacillus salinarum TaxID=2932255 RepID=A0ABY4GKY8_9BACI|nr:glycine betaine ABC transporter substrate-binding protein [Gracilibacillus salinarum]UOQ84422.1 glycine/betaine ABC transporter [Gracilibacillus salinarum]
MKNYKKLIGLMIIVTFILVAAGCGQEDSNTNDEEGTESVGEAVEYTITGIEAGAGITEATKNALSEYENLSGWEQETSSTAAMITELGEAIDNEEPIIVAGWSPHYKFAQYDLKYLEDPKGVYGEAENINTIARKGLEEDMPGAYTILDRFKWGVEDSEAFLLESLESEFEEVAQQWVDEHQEDVAEWTEGVEQVDGTELEIALAPWDSERAPANILKIVLEQHGFNVTLTTVDPAVMFEAIASGDADASPSAWLPITHSAFYEDYKEDIVDLGPNLEGAKTGLVVPSYMEIDSIEDLKAAE